uniref:Syntaxin n=1 Tax=Solanum tuberosum TaxID=4113 RepID=M1CK56_SOLTU
MSFEDLESGSSLYVQGGSGSWERQTKQAITNPSASDNRQSIVVTKKIADAKLAKDFQSVLKKFQNAQQLAAQREAAYTPFISQEIISSRSTEIQISSSISPESGSTLLESKRQDVVQLEHEIVFNETIIEEREQGMIEIQQQIGELNEMFKDLALLVHEQGTMLDDISSNIESSHDATAQAAKQLTKASKIQQCNSSMTSGSIHNLHNQKGTTIYFLSSTHPPDPNKGKNQLIQQAKKDITYWLLRLILSDRIQSRKLISITIECM